MQSRRLNPEYVKAVREGVNHCPYFHLLSMRIEELGMGTSRLEITIAGKHLQPFGMVHGGVFSSIVDAASFWAIFPLLDEGLGLTTVEMKLNYLAPAAGGNLIALGKCLKLGKTLGLARAEVKDHKGRLLAYGTGTMMVLPDLKLPGSEIFPPKFLK
jgi:uncharacterized protein (TIGR00369 family)